MPTQERSKFWLTAPKAELLCRAVGSWAPQEYGRCLLRKNALLNSWMRRVYLGDVEAVCWCFQAPFSPVRASAQFPYSNHAGWILHFHTEHDRRAVEVLMASLGMVVSSIFCVSPWWEYAIEATSLWISNAFSWLHFTSGALVLSSYFL